MSLSKHKFLTAILAAMVLASCTTAVAQEQHNQPTDQVQPAVAPAVAEEDLVIQIALLLDTSNSMDGLIDQAKAQLWRIVNELVKAQKQGVEARMEVALYEYGNDRLSRNKGYIRRILTFSEDLDKISEELFALHTNGGSEFCGQVTFEAVRDLEWNGSKNNLKVIYIAGNEGYTQGPVHFRKASNKAKRKNVLINTIHCGNFQTGKDGQWAEGARIALGSYANIDHNREAVNIDAPQDDEIIRLNRLLNDTYVAYGRHGNDRMVRQKAQDANASRVSKSVMAKRAISKGGRLYKNSSWDMVDAVDQKKIDLDKLKESSLPKELKGKTKEEIKAYVAKKKAERQEIKKQIAKLKKERAIYVKEKLAQLKKQGQSTLDDVIIATLRAQAEAKGYTFNEI